jgi:hypothetical protein
MPHGHLDQLSRARSHGQVRWRMRIVMMTNTYAPHVGGVARSVEAFATE